MPIPVTSFRQSFVRTGLCAVLVLVAAAAFAIEPVPPPQTSVAPLLRTDARLTPSAVTVPLEKVEGLAPEVRESWTRFRAAQRGDWKAYVDRRSGRVEAVEGAGIPWIPGRGNKLTLDDVASLAGERGEVGLATLEKVARRFLETWAPLLGVDPRALVLDKGRSAHPADYLWFVDFNVGRGDPLVLIEGARVVFRVNHGNLVQFGSENLPAPDAPAPQPRLSREEALARLNAASGGLAREARFVDPGSLRLVPAAPDKRREADFRLGAGRGLVAVWQFVFTRPQATETWQARIDALSGELLELHDTNRYAQVSGGAFPNAPAVGAELALPMPFADVSSGGYTNSAGLYTWGGGAVTSALNGQYVLINDNCGAISQASDALGQIAFGVSGGTDCTTPGSGGAGNTHSARTQFYHVNRAKEAARTWLPAVAWLNAQLQVNVNINLTCNAYWNGATLNFYRSGGGCANTGEIAGVSLHEYGHGLDSNDGNGSSPDYGTGETYGDLTGVLATHASCIGPGFRATNCSGSGDACTSCTGVRDIDWALHTSGAAHTVANFTQVRCPTHPWYLGPCGREGHCESYVLSEALWDFVARDLPSPGSASAWDTLQRLWYVSRPTATAGFVCNTAPAVWTSDGCAAGTYWRALRAADDDDGNLANGTPHSCALFAAFDRHGVACAADTGANVCFSGCTPPAVPTVTLTPASNQVTVSWTNSGAGIVYDVYRNESGCGAGFSKIANDVAVTSYVDTAVANHGIYYYQVVAHPAGSEACSAAPSACASTTPGVDVWSQDRTTDTGLEPDPATAGQPMWESQDIWVRNDASAGPHQNPIAGQVNYVHVRVRNRGTASGAFNVEVYFANASTGLSWPTHWTLISSAPVAALAHGADTEVTVNWTPTLTGHFCLVARLVNAQDPLTYAETTSINTNVRNNNNLVWKNVAVVAVSPAAPVSVTLLVPNPSAKQAGRFKLVFEEVRPRELPATAALLRAVRLDLRVGPREAIELEPLRPSAPVRTPVVRNAAVRDVAVRDLKTTLLRVPLRENEVQSLRLTFRALPGVAPGLRTAPYLLRVRQIDEQTGELVGGMTYEIHVSRR